MKIRFAETRRKRGVEHSQVNLPGDQSSTDIPRPRAILWILRQKCLRWRAMGIANLPSYCYSSLGNRRLTARRINLNRFDD
ncbi:hypothetical protein ACOMHN_059289 [Nucella lapillus]